MDKQDEKLYVKESLLKEQQYSAGKRYTYADYASWDDDNRYELIDGEAILMYAPSWVHQGILTELVYQLRGFLKGKPCKVFPGPVDVCLYGLGDDDRTVVQPDVLVVCDMPKLGDRKRCNGAPDLAIEVLSPSNPRHDTFVKFNKYLHAGVREYWIVDPEMKSVHVHKLDNDKYNTSVFGESDIIPVHVLEGCQINMNDVWQEVQP